MLTLCFPLAVLTVAELCKHCPKPCSTLPTRTTSQLQDIIWISWPRAQNLQQTGACTNPIRLQNSTLLCAIQARPPPKFPQNGNASFVNLLPSYSSFTDFPLLHYFPYPFINYLILSQLMPLIPLFMFLIPFIYYTILYLMSYPFPNT